MNGDGLDDKILITEDGHISVWFNGQANPKAEFHWNWFSQNGGKPVATGVNAKREQYRLADVGPAILVSTALTAREPRRQRHPGTDISVD